MAACSCQSLPGTKKPDLPCPITLTSDDMLAAHPHACLLAMFLVTESMRGVITKQLETELSQDTKGVAERWRAALMILSSCLLLKSARSQLQAADLSNIHLIEAAPRRVR